MVRHKTRRLSSLRSCSEGRDTSLEEDALSCTSSSRLSLRHEIAGMIGRRALLSVAGFVLSIGQTAAWAGGNPAVTRGLGNYVKKKKLDKIDTYLPPLFLARDQLIRVERVMLLSPSEARKLLRSGAFSGLRENIRSVGEYVSREQENEALGKKLVANFFSELQAVDFALLSATRSQGEGSGLDIDATRSHLHATVKALDALIEQVPVDIVEKSKSIAAAVDAMDAEASNFDLDEESRLSKLIK